MTKHNSYLVGSPRLCPSSNKVARSWYTNKHNVTVTVREPNLDPKWEEGMYITPMLSLCPAKFKPDISYLDTTTVHTEGLA